ncbi:ATP-binding cassette domain-containing protein [Timonella sp. A28]|uniref:ATP-binding cassette domain-containing protein n=1 Tax=Timonella sp. A28 TaxID=3442640 RepID=UPI003EB96268
MSETFSGVVPADSHTTIKVRGAHTNNLKSVDIDIAKRRLTVFTGVSGSGKSSLVFGVIAAESQRLINETYTTFVQSFMPSNARPEVDELSNLSAAIVVNQDPIGANSRSTVGTATDASAFLRTIFSRVGSPAVPVSAALSFNTPAGMCMECEGGGEVNSLDLDELVDRELTLNEGALTIPGFQVGAWYWQIIVESKMFDPDKKLKDYTDEEWHLLVYQEAMKVNVGTHNATYEGLVPKVKRTIMSKDREKAQSQIRAFMDRAATFEPCPACKGTRLNAAALECRIDGVNIADVSAMQVSDIRVWLNQVDTSAVAPVAANLAALLQGLEHIGLGYLSLDRVTGTLSGGEAQRVKMVRHVGSALTDVTYVFDEPTVGLHPHDIARMNELLVSLRDKGNTVLVVEHKPEVIAIADQVVDMGPKAGTHGGEIVFQGSVAELASSGTLTGEHLRIPARLKEDDEGVRSPAGKAEIRRARQHNLKDVSVDVPLGCITAVTGVAGSGKSSLIHSNIKKAKQVFDSAGHPALDVEIVDQAAIRGSRRSNPATYTGVLDPIRAAFAKANNVKPALFSANSAGACENCNGSGLIFTELGFMQTVSSTCETCEGKRFTQEVLNYTFEGANIHDVLSMSMEQALEFFTAAKVKKAVSILENLNRVGLGYIRLGQPLNTLSGGERQRLKLAVHMGTGKKLYVLDEPTTGLHMADVDLMLGLLDHLVEQGNSVIVIEHNLRVIAHADWVIDLGPGAGHDGGTIVFEGTPKALTGSDTLTGTHLANYLQH